MWAALSAIGLPAGRALDLGCGPGTEAMFLASMGWSVVAIDKDAVEIGVAKKRAKRLPRAVAKRLTFVAGDGISWREKRRGGFQLVHDRLLFSNLWGDAADIYSREERDHDANRLELIEAAAFALQTGGLFVLRMRQWSDAIAPFEKERGLDTLEWRELKHADRWFERGPELGYLGFATPDGPSRSLKRLSMSVQVWRRNAKKAPAR
jgi:SAM-dependent methyltransferase